MFFKPCVAQFLAPLEILIHKMYVKHFFHLYKLFNVDQNV